MKSVETVKNYFDKAAVRFDAIYDGKKPRIQKVVDHLFRQVVVDRHKLICNLAPGKNEWSVLDVGCGSGRYSIQFAKQGAQKVVGVDVSQIMVDLAAQEAKNEGVEKNCEFIRSAFLDYKTPNDLFDVVVATGYFDYLEDPLPHLKKMLALCSGKIFASFPKRWEIRVPIRRLRFILEQGYVRFYNKQEVLDLFKDAGVTEDRLSLVDLGRDWIAIARPLPLQ